MKTLALLPLTRREDESILVRFSDCSHGFGSEQRCWLVSTLPGGRAGNLSSGKSKQGRRVRAMVQSPKIVFQGGWAITCASRDWWSEVPQHSFLWEVLERSKSPPETPQSNHWRLEAGAHREAPGPMRSVLPCGECS